MKYELTENTIEYNNCTLYQIRALRDIGNHTKAGQLGGWLSINSTMSQEDNCWIDKDVKVSDQIHIGGDAYVTGDLVLDGHGCVSDNVYIDADGRIVSDMYIKGSARITSDIPGWRVKLDITGKFYLNDYVQIKHDLTSHNQLSLEDKVILDCPLDIGDSNMELSGDTVISMSPIFYHASHEVIITPGYICVDGEKHTTEEWFAFNEEDIFLMNGDRRYYWLGIKEDINTILKTKIETVKISNPNKIHPHSTYMI